MFNIGFSEAVLISLVALIVLGPEKLPEIGRLLGKLTLEFRRAVAEIKRELDLEELEKEVEETKKEIDQTAQGLTEPLKDPIKLLDEYKEPKKGEPKI